MVCKYVLAGSQEFKLKPDCLILCRYLYSVERGKLEVPDQTLEVDIIILLLPIVGIGILHMH